MILSKTDAMKRLICSGKRGEDQDELKHRFIYLAAVARLAREAKESQDVYLSHKVICSLSLIDAMGDHS